MKLPKRQHFAQDFLAHHVIDVRFLRCVCSCDAVTVLFRHARGSVHGSLWAAVQFRAIMLGHAGRSRSRLPGHPGQLSDLRERHHVAEHERQHPVYTTQRGSAVRAVYTAG